MAGWPQLLDRASHGFPVRLQVFKSGRRKNDVWELYNLEDDWSQANDLAAKMPEKLAQLKEIFLIEAAKNKVLPIGGGLWIPALHPEMRIAPPRMRSGPSSVTPYANCEGN
jgi:arylsulfatase A-like enzyme